MYKRQAEGREGLPERDRSIIARCVGEAYRECARDGRLPTLGDFHAALLAQPEPEAADIALRYERYVKGAFSFFNGQSNVAVSYTHLRATRGAPAGPGP